MDIPTDIWGQLALEAGQVYLTEGGQVRSPFANTVNNLKAITISALNIVLINVEIMNRSNCQTLGCQEGNNRD